MILSDFAISRTWLPIKCWCPLKCLSSFQTLTLLSHIRHLRLSSSGLLGLPLYAVIILVILLARCNIQLIIFGDLNLMYPLPILFLCSQFLAITSKLFHGGMILSLLFGLRVALFFPCLIKSRSMMILRLAVLIDMRGLYGQEWPRFRRPLFLLGLSISH